MGKIDSDYLWLHEQPQRASNLRWIALLLLLPVVCGATWLTVNAETDTSTNIDRSLAYNPNHGRSNGFLVDAQVGPRHAPMRAPVDLGAHENPVAKTSIIADQNTDDATDKQPHTTAIPLAPAAVEPALSEEGPLGKTPTQSAPAELAATEPGDSGNKIADVQAESARVDTSEPDTANPNTAGWREITIEPGDTLSIAFNRNNLSYAESLKIAHMPKYGSRFTRGLKAGETLRVRDDGDGHVMALDFPLNALKTLEVRPNGDGFKGHIARATVQHRKTFVTGVIGNSFYVDALEAGLTDRQIMRLVKIFGWDVDFALDIRPGDRFVVVYDELYRDGEKIANGNILATAFINQGHEIRAVRYTNGDHESAYYSPAGREMRKAFIRTPVDYTRISSPFSLARKHPILNRIRRHEGTDYAAPSGTPIRATGNGRIVFRGRRGGYGNMIILRHDDHITTRYGHMSRFAKSYGVGSKVKQGDVIGYVGMTGLATGPHLHYEFRVDGKPKDPEKAPPRALPIPKKYMADFKHHAAPLLAQLDTLTETTVAQAGVDDGKRTN